MTSVGRHALDLLMLVVVLAGPVPLGVVLAGETRVRHAPAVHCLLVVLTSWFACATAIGLTLGACHELRLPDVLLANGLLFLAGLACALPLRGRMPSPTCSRADALVLLVVLLIGAALFTRVALTPITDHDSLAYHLPILATWYQAGGFVKVDGFGLVESYPYGWEVLSALFVMPFGEDFVVALPNVLGCFVLGFGVYLLARRLGADGLNAVAATVLLLGMPLIRGLVPTLHVDLAVGAFFIASLYFALTYVGDPSLANAAVTSAAFGMLAGVKIPGLVYGGLAASAALLLHRLHPGDAATGPSPAPPVRVASVVVGGSGILVGTFWYARNLMATGNPFGTITLGSRGLTPPPGAFVPQDLRGTTLLALFHVASGADWHVLLGALHDQVGLLIAAFLLLGCVGRRPAHGLGLVVIAATVAYGATPFSADRGQYGRITPWVGQTLRYALPAIASAAVWAAARAPRRIETVVATLAIGFVLTGIGNRHAVAAIAVVLLGLLAARTVRANRIGRGLLIASALPILLLTTLWMRNGHAVARRAAYGAIGDFLDAAVGRNQTVGYTLSHDAYRLYGPHLDRHVVRLPAVAGRNPAWIDDVRRRGIDVLAIGPLPVQWRARADARWLNELDGPFVRIFGTDVARETVVYRVASEPP